jgi:hypothetical protein
MAKMGEKTLSFVEKAHEFAQQNPNLVPPFLDMAAFDTDFADAHNLWSVVWGINAGSFSKPALREELLLFLNK